MSWTSCGWVVKAERSLRYIIILRCSDVISGWIHSELKQQDKCKSCCSTRCEWNSIELMLLYHTILWCNQQNGAIERDGEDTKINEDYPQIHWALGLPRWLYVALKLLKQTGKQNQSKRLRRPSVCVSGRCVFPAALARLLVLPSTPRDARLLSWAIQLMNKSHENMPRSYFTLKSRENYIKWCFAWRESCLCALWHVFHDN